MVLKWTAMAVLCFGSAVAGAQTQHPQFGGKYADLRPAQKALVDRWIAEYRVIFKRDLNAQQTYDRFPLSARTTFEAVTHALSRTSLTTSSGKPLGTALDLVDMVERVAGHVPDTRGDEQFRVWVYLKRGATDKLYAAREFKRDHDNTVFHIGYPLNFRQVGGAPSIQISVARDGLRGDIDVDYRPSGGPSALINGHLTAANSDVRAGDNYSRHVNRWQGFSDWWRELLAGLAVPPRESAQDLTPAVGDVREKVAHGPLQDAIHLYLTNWLIDQQPETLLPVISVKAFPCVAEFKDGSRPDSRLAHLRILRRMMEQNKMLGKVNRLEDVVQPVEYPLPGAQVVQQPYQSLFGIQNVPDDVAWAMDCRLRYKLDMAEAVPRPEHKLGDTYVATMRIKNPKEPAAFLVETWRKESGEWRLVSFDIKRHSKPPDMSVIESAGPPPADPSPGMALDTATKLLTSWFVDRNVEQAATYFLPSAFSCDQASDAAPAKSAANPSALKKFLAETSATALKKNRLEQMIAAPRAGHPGLKPGSHKLSRAFLIGTVSTELMNMHACSTGRPKPASRQTSADTTGGVLTAFRLISADKEEYPVISLYWKKVQGGWRVAAYDVEID